jgi:hypothetical protein
MCTISLHRAVLLEVLELKTIIIYINMNSDLSPRWETLIQHSSWPVKFWLTTVNLAMLKQPPPAQVVHVAPFICL